MIVITVRFHVLPEYAEQWPELTRAFTEATRAEPGNRWFRWSRSLDDPNEFSCWRPSTTTRPRRT